MIKFLSQRRATDNGKLVSKMAALVRRSTLLTKSVFAISRPLSVSVKRHGCNKDVTTHTGQSFDNDDYRKIRFEDKSKLVNTRFAIDLIAEDPVVVCTERVVFSDGGGALGHPKVYINLDAPGYHICGYSGRKFVLKKYYDECTMGPSITYEEYLEQANHTPDLNQWPN